MLVKADYYTHCSIEKSFLHIYISGHHHTSSGSQLQLLWNAARVYQYVHVSLSAIPNKSVDPLEPEKQ